MEFVLFQDKYNESGVRRRWQQQQGKARVARADDTYANGVYLFLLFLLTRFVVVVVVVALCAALLRSRQIVA